MLFQLPIEKQDGLPVLQQGRGTQLSLQHAQSWEGLGPTAASGPAPQEWSQTISGDPAALPASGLATSSAQEAHSKRRTGYSVTLLLFMCPSTFAPPC